MSRRGAITTRPSREGALPEIGLHVVRDSARVVEAIPEADPSAVAKAPRQQLAEAVVQRELALRDELHHDGRDEAFRDAAGAEAVLGASLAAADLGLRRGDDDPVAVVLDERDHGGDVARGD